MTKDQALQIVEKDSQYFVQSFSLKDGEVKLKQVYGPFNAEEAIKVKAMTTAQREKYKKRQVITDVKSQPCLDCGQLKQISEMTFDHIRGEKIFNIANGSKKSWNQLLKEIEKCEIVCRSCHNVREYLRGVMHSLVDAEDLATLLLQIDK